MKRRVSNKPRKKRCGTCGPCLAEECGVCENCRGKKKFGGDGSSHNCCMQRRCSNIYGPVSSVQLSAVAVPQQPLTAIGVGGAGAESLTEATSPPATDTKPATTTTSTVPSSNSSSHSRELSAPPTSLLEEVCHSQNSTSSSPEPTTTPTDSSSSGQQARTTIAPAVLPPARAAASPPSPDASSTNSQPKTRTTAANILRLKSEASGATAAPKDEHGKSSPAPSPSVQRTDHEQPPPPAEVAASSLDSHSHDGHHGRNINTTKKKKSIDNAHAGKAMEFSTSLSTRFSAGSSTSKKNNISSSPVPPVQARSRRSPTARRRTAKADPAVTIAVQKEEVKMDMAPHFVESIILHPPPSSDVLHQQQRLSSPNHERITSQEDREQETGAGPTAAAPGEAARESHKSKSPLSEKWSQDEELLPDMNASTTNDPSVCGSKAPQGVVDRGNTVHDDAHENMSPPLLTSAAAMQEQEPQEKKDRPVPGAFKKAGVRKFTASRQDLDLHTKEQQGNAATKEPEASQQLADVSKRTRGRRTTASASVALGEATISEGEINAAVNNAGADVDMGSAASATSTAGSPGSDSGGGAGGPVVLDPVKDQWIKQRHQQAALRRRCGECDPCKRDDCGTCVNCQGKTKFGGDGRNRYCCVNRRCLFIYGHKQQNSGKAYAKTTRQIERIHILSAEKKLRRKRAHSEIEQDGSIAEITLKGVLTATEHQLLSSADLGTADYGSPCCTNLAETQEFLNVKDHVERHPNTRLDFSYPCNAHDAIAISDGSYKIVPISMEQDAKLYGMDLPETPPDNVCAACLKSTIVNPATSDQKQGGNEQGSQSAHDGDDANMGEFEGKAEKRAVVDLERTMSDCTIPRSADTPQRNRSSEGHTVILCDGKGCNREYHLRCCSPPLTNVPDGAWYCEDCSPMGTADYLLRYLESNDERRSIEFDSNSTLYASHLLRQDCLQEGVTVPLPVSELERAGEIIAAIPRGKEFLNPGEEKEAAPDYLIGKPIRLYEPTMSCRHMGRIVDVRERSKEASDNDNGAPTYEYYVRFAAGKDGRKQMYHHWIVLEEHSMEVGISLLWAKFPLHKSEWLPAMLWLRTGRELASSRARLNNLEGDGVHRPSPDSAKREEIPDSTSPKKKSKRSSRRSKQAKVWGLVSAFAFQGMELVDLKEESISWFHPLVAKYTEDDDDHAMKYVLLAAEQELVEQSRVRCWRKLPAVNPLGPRAISSRHEYSLPPLRPINWGQPIVSYHAGLCPNVPRGLDRLKIMEQARKFGIQPSKDAAASIRCQFVPIHHFLRAERRRANKKPKQGPPP